jgi:pyruvate dehydrogenase (quinone)
MAEEERLVADLVVERLRAWGVERVFGHSGDGINTVLGAMRRAGDALEFVQARHEETAALMAVGHAKYTGGVGVVLATQGPGAVHLLNGLYDAKLDSQRCADCLVGNAFRCGRTRWICVSGWWPRSMAG